MAATPSSEGSFRPNLYVVARFLDCLAEPDREWTRTQLQAAVGVNYDILRRYLLFLDRKRYVTIRGVDGGPDTIRLTAEGRRIRTELRRWLERFLVGAQAEDPPNAPQGATPDGAGSSARDRA